MSTLPKNISAYYKGELALDEVVEVFGEHDLFIFPTLERILVM